ncbi:MAG: DUF4097 domain-containing protein [Chloroflexi bacterium]|nr:DUF4097 domain-containing protein [Chloroflexota bacterium]
MSQETIKRKFDVTAPAHLIVTNIRGSVDVQPSDNGIVTITAVKHLDTGDADRTEIEIVQKEDGSVRVRTRFEEGIWQLFNLGRPCKVDYVVHVPRDCDLKVRCVSSKASVYGLSGKFDIKTVSGRVTLKDISGKIKATSVSGRIMGERLSGPTAFESVSGRVHLTESSLPVVTGSSVSGDLVVETFLIEGPYSLKTMSGDLNLILPPEIGCTIGFNSVSGRLKTSLPTTRSKWQRHKWLADLQGGGPEIRFHSVSGDFSVTQAVAQ